MKKSRLYDDRVRKNILRFSFFLIFILLFPIAYNYQAILVDFKGNTFELLQKNSSASGLAVEGIAADFETDLSYLLSNPGLVLLLQEKDPDRDAMILLERFYSKYNYFVSGIRIQGGNIQRDFTLSSGNYFSSTLIQLDSAAEREQPAWVDGETRIVYSKDIVRNGRVVAEMQILLDIRGLVHRELSKYYTMSNSWYWLLNRDGVVLSALFSEFAVSSSDIKATLVEQVVADIRQNYEGTLEHSMIGVNPSELLTAYYPITVFGQRYGVLFSVDREAAFKAVTYRTVIITLCFVLMIALVSVFFLFVIGKQRKTEKLLVQAKDALEDTVKERTIELIESEEKYRLLFEKSEDPMMILTHRHIVMANNAVFKVLGYDRLEELIGTPITAHSPEFQPDGVNSVEKALAMEAITQASGYYRFEWLLTKKDGSELPIDVSLTKIPYQHTDSLFCLFRDMTGAKDAEREKQRLEMQLQQSQKMEAIGLMAGGVAHDLNNILAGIVGYPELMMRQLPEDSPLIKPLGAIFDSGKRASMIVADLLTISRDAARATEVKNLNKLVEEYFSSPEFYKLHSHHPQVDFRTDLRAEKADISCSPVHVKKCIMNLITNGAEAVKEKGMVLVRSSFFPAESYRELPANLIAGRYVVLEIQDTGHGIPEGDLDHIFEPFYSKKIMGRSGTGLGLTVVWKTMNDHRGTVIVESGSAGTVFKLFFPVSENTAEEKTSAIDFTVLQTGQCEKILVVDDEPYLRDIACQMLESLGYATESANSGEDAIERVKQNDYDLLVVDMLMEPGMNGYQTYEKIVSMKPEQKAIIASGFSMNRDVEAALRLGAGDFIKKPYTIEQLGLAVKRSLGK